MSDWKPSTLRLLLAFGVVGGIVGVPLSVLLLPSLLGRLVALLLAVLTVTGCLYPVFGHLRRLEEERNRQNQGLYDRLSKERW